MIAIVIDPLDSVLRSLTGTLPTVAPRVDGAFQYKPLDSERDPEVSIQPVLSVPKLSDRGRQVRRHHRWAYEPRGARAPTDY